MLISFRADKDTINRLQQLADQHDRTLSAELRRAIRQYVNGRHRDNGPPTTPEV